MLISFSMKMAIIRLTCHPEIMISVFERTVVSPVASYHKSENTPNLVPNHTISQILSGFA
jgi:hypothetical protein